MLDQDYILLIANCKKYTDKANLQKQTWLKNLKNIIYFHIIGDPLLDDDDGFSFDYKNNILYVQTEDDYNSLPKKMIAAYKAIASTYNFKYIFKTDDDQHLNNDRFFEAIIKIINNQIYKISYAGKIVDVKVPYKSEYYKIHPELPHDLIIQKTKYCSGRFYLLSRAAIKSLLMERKNIEKEYLEDYAIGFYLPSFLKDSHHMLNIDTDKYFQDIK